ncbi:hypothetical protein JYP52_01530 [Nitratireductor aquibiodomus]|uniref:hypothetical protein n=1 Tax=Nitratireductor TaxID=245876 RepID=UPI0019D34865|nr:MULTISPECIES: hypothetical protein [Nitratireductor]MBN7759804.1 hypothetical protein [Nitratireductor aquibiodomus]MCV0350169.1 hypothetical protein [Nitratireductor sp.]
MREKITFLLAGIALILSMVLVPPLTGILAYVLWIQTPLPVDMEIPAILAGIWTGVVTAALVKRGFE